MQTTTVRHVSSAPFWRAAHAVLPIGFRINAPLRWVLGDHERFRVPWGPFGLTISGSWIRESTSASAPIYLDPRRQNPEYFAVLDPVLPSSEAGAIVDVGANMGTYVLNMRARSDAPIVAFEPDPFMFRLLSETIESNHLTQVTLKNLACGDSDGSIRFQSGINGNVLPEGAGAGDASTITVPVVRLDDELRDLPRIGLVKIDCEGFEWNILKGGMRIIREQRPMVFVELHPKPIRSFGHSLDEVCDLLAPTHELQFWDVNPKLRSSSRLGRFLARYSPKAVRLRDRAALLETAARTPGPDQLFLLAVGKPGSAR